MRAVSTVSSAFTASVLVAVTLESSVATFPLAASISASSFALISFATLSVL